MPRQRGNMTLLELSKYAGHDPMRPLLLAVRGRVFDVTNGRAFYGPGARDSSASGTAQRLPPPGASRARWGQMQRPARTAGPPRLAPAPP